MTLPNFAELLTTYAQLVVKIGAGVKKGDTVYIQAGVPQADFVHLLTEHAYELGAAEVMVKWNDDVLTREFLLHAPEERLKQFKESQAAEIEYALAHNAKRISVVSEIPGSLSGVSAKRLADYQSANAKGQQPMRRATQNNDVSWTVVAVANPAWAQKVFPDLTESAALDELWHQIFEATRIYTEDPIAAWEEHAATLSTKAQELNNFQFDKLIYRAPGTELSIGLPQNHVWESAGATNLAGDPFIPNMPTEEVFTAPDKNRIDGYVSSTKPLSYGGQILSDMRFDFAKGKIVKVTAENGQETLQKLIETDDGSHSLGEVSLVPNSSPISQSGVIFFNTLFDENASNHLAIGSAYPSNVTGGTKMSPLELQKHGINVSTVHVDFMVGSGEMDIDGIMKDGSVVPVFRNGEWVI